MTLSDMGKSILATDEGCSKLAYMDTATPPRITVGVGRNLTDKGLSDAEIDLLFANDCNECVAWLTAIYPWVANLTQPRFDALVNMRFNLGAKGFASFTRFLMCMQARDFGGAAAELKNSAAYRELPNRYGRLVMAILNG